MERDWRLWKKNRDGRGPARNLAAAALVALSPLGLGCGESAGALQTTAAKERGNSSFDGSFVRLSGTEAGSETVARDLEALAGWLEGASLVGLGESLHGVHEFHRLSHRIFEHLARNEGFSVFALEISQAHAAALNEFVHGRRDDLDALLAGHWWTAAVFYDRSLRDLLIWMREYNQTAARPVSVAGFDFKQPSFAMDSVVAGLEPLDPQAADRAEDLFAAVRELGGFGVFPNVYGYSASLGVSLPARSGAHSVRVQVMIRGQGVTHGKIGLSASSGGSSGERPKVRSLDGGKLDATWRPIDVEFDAPDSLDEVRVTIFHRGNGSVWFDGLAVELGGRSLELDDPLSRFAKQGLLIPDMQVMDYRSSFDPEIRFEASGSSLRIDCDSGVDKALEAARAGQRLVEEVLAAGGGGVQAAEAVWLRQMARLVVQSVEWRTLVENNRDVLMAENVVWLGEEGFPGSRILALAHASHTDRINGRMGGFLADEYGDSYATVKMLAQSGVYRTFDVPSAYEPGTLPQPREFPIHRDAGSLEQRLSMSSEVDLLVHLDALRNVPEAREELAWSGWSDQTPDVAIVLGAVGPIVDLREESHAGPAPGKLPSR